MNVASRVEGLTRVYGVHVIVTESVRAGADGFVYRELDRVQVKGRATPLRIFEPLGETGALADESLARLDRWHESLTRYRNRDWEEAADIVASLVKGEPESPLYELYRERIAHLRQAPPGPGWNGVYVSAKSRPDTPLPRIRAAMRPFTGRPTTPRYSSDGLVISRIAGTHSSAGRSNIVGGTGSTFASYLGGGIS